MSTPARDLLGRLDAAGVRLALDRHGNLEWQAAAEPPADLLAEARRLKPALLALLRSEAANANGGGLAAPTDADVEALARTLLAEAARNPAVTRIDEAKATLYYKGEAKRRLDLIRQRAIDATTGPDIEREAIEAEEHQPMAAPDDHKRAVAGLLLAASPLAGLPGARPCRSCGRGIWCSSGWRGLPRDLCFACAREEAP